MEEDDGAKVRFFPPGIPLLAIFAGSIIEWIAPMDIGYIFPTPERYYLGGALAVGAILIFGLWSVVLFRKAGQNENPWKPTPSIEVHGPYKVTRNPMYLQMVLVCIGVGIAFGNYWILLLTPVVAWALHICAIKPEEEYLEEKFGEGYLSYKARVRRWL